MATKSIPYGVADFERIIRENCYYVDKTRYIVDMEEKASYLFLIRPRRFGKSLFQNMLAAYYDIAKRDEFDELFGSLWIGRHPTPERNRYQVLRLDFSMVSSSASGLGVDFNTYLCITLDGFMLRYQSYYSAKAYDDVRSMANAKDKLRLINDEAKRQGYPLYLIIDEYDNFTNVVLTNDGKEAFHALTHANGFYRDYFKVFKAMFTRVFLIGVSPVTLDDVTSGYNIDWNISNEPEFNAMLGFSEDDVRQMFRYYQAEGRLQGDIEEMIAEMRPWYDNYCFSADCLGKETCFNCDMVFYYLKHRLAYNRAPEDMVDKNVRTDYKKLRMLADIDRGSQREDRMSVIEEITNKGYIDMHLRTSFPAMDIMDMENFRSLVYYYGMLTIGGRRGDMLRMVIPNLCVQAQYWSFMVQFYQRIANLNIVDMRVDMLNMAYDGLWAPVIERVACAYRDTSSVRDSIKGEHNLQGFFKAYLTITDMFIVRPEIEMNYGYSDFMMLADTKKYSDLQHSYVMELKYVKPTATDNELAEKEVKAEDQLRQYAADKSLQRIAAGTTLHLLTVIFRGADMVVCREIGNRE